MREQLGGADPKDWEAFGVVPGASPDAIRARWRELAKSLHPDTGGDVAAFVRMQGVYQRLLAADQVDVRAVPGPADLFDPVIPNPHRGWFDFYSTKFWPAAAAATLVTSILADIADGRVTH